ncbi:hypothetical protein VTN02DRAFT_1756 [Thermoascus thermophilus]
MTLCGASRALSVLPERSAPKLSIINTRCVPPPSDVKSCHHHHHLPWKPFGNSLLYDDLRSFVPCPEISKPN